MDIIGNFISWVLEHILAFFSAVMETIHNCFGDLFNTIYYYILEFLSSSSFESIGSDFFGVIYSRSQRFTFSFNIIYWLVGLYIGLFVLRRFIIPIIIAIVDDLIDLFTPS